MKLGFQPLAWWAFLAGVDYGSEVPDAPDWDEWIAAHASTRQPESAKGEVDDNGILRCSECGCVKGWHRRDCSQATKADKGEADELATIRDNIEVVKACIGTALEGYRHDSSWIRPMRLTMEERAKEYQTAAAYLNDALAALDRLAARRPSAEPGALREALEKAAKCLQTIALGPWRDLGLESITNIRDYAHTNLIEARAALATPAEGTTREGHDCNSCRHDTDLALCTIAKGNECHSARRWTQYFRPDTDFWEPRAHEAPGGKA